MVRYRFHALRGGSFPVIRLHYVHEEACYIIRRPDGRPLSLPVWMTQPQAATAEIVTRARLSRAALLEIRRLTTAYLSSLASQDSEGGQDGTTMGNAGTPIRRQQTKPGTTIKRGGAEGSRSGACELDANVGESNRDGGERWAR